MLRFGWKHYAQADMETSMKRFNQAWLLDSLNAEAYIGFGTILNDQGKYNESLQVIERGIQLNPQSAEAWKLSGFVNINLFNDNKDEKTRDKSVEHLKKAIAIRPSDARTYAILTKAYAHYHQQDSARKYLKITDDFEPYLIEDKVREHIMKR
jgi:tetratricopeptide (TPR) repeat protein